MLLHKNGKRDKHIKYTPRERTRWVYKQIWNSGSDKPSLPLLSKTVANLFENKFWITNRLWQRGWGAGYMTSPPRPPRKDVQRQGQRPRERQRARVAQNVRTSFAFECELRVPSSQFHSSSTIPLQIYVYIYASASAWESADFCFGASFTSGDPFA